jgi:hypothetical protein
MSVYTRTYIRRALELIPTGKITFVCGIEVSRPYDGHHKPNDQYVIGGHRHTLDEAVAVLSRMAAEPGR